MNEIPELAELRSAVPRGAYRPARITRGRPRPDNPHYDPAPEDSYGDFPAIRPYGDDSTLSSTSPQPSSTDSDTSSPSRGDISLEYFPDPTWVLQHGRRVDCFESNEAKFFPSRGCKTLAPLEYKRLSPYPVRHPLDNVALRLFDAAPWMTAHW